MNKERGLYRGPTEDSFKSEQKIKRELALKGYLPEIDYQTDIQETKDIGFYLEQSEKRAKQRKELSPRADQFVGLKLPETSIFNVLADLHFGHYNMFEDRLRQELEVILNTPHSYILLNGDLVHGIHWGGAAQSEQSATLDEQRGFLRSLFDMAEGRVILATSGEHDSKWAARSGSDPYFDFTERTGAPYVRGVAELEVDVGGTIYKGVVQHRARGHSQYNKNHPTFREARFELQGADFYISSHTHTKQISRETIRHHGGARYVTHVSTGPYTTGGEYSERSGYPKQDPKELFGASLRLHKSEKYIEHDYDILRAHERWV